MGSNKFVVTLPRVLKERLKLLSDQWGVSQATIIRNALWNYFIDLGLLGEKDELERKESE